MKRKNRLAILPKELIKAINALELTPTQTYNAIQLCEIITSKQAQQNMLLEDTVHISRIYLEKTYQDTRYNKWLDQLVAADIIERNDFYTFDLNDAKKSICKAYRINTKLRTNNLSKINYKVLDNNFSNGNSLLNPVVNLEDNLFTIITVNKDKVNDKNKLKSLFLNDMKGLSLNTKEMKRVVKETIDNLTIDKFRVNEEIPYKTWMKFSYREEGEIELKEKSGSLTHAIEFAKEMGADLIQDKQRIIVKEKSQFIKDKKKAIYAAYMDSILRLEKKDFYAKRNSTNNRLDTNITNMCSHLKKIIMKENNLGSLDLNNSQFSFLSFVLQDKLSTEDFKRFKDLSTSGELYDYLKEKFSLSSRKEAKVNCFELLFSGRRNPSQEKRDLKKEFPSVVGWIDDFKKKHGDKNFAIELQKVESDIFIDNLYCILRDNMDFCLTVHDSFLVKEKDLEIAAKLMTEFFRGIAMDCTIQIENGEETNNIEVRPLPTPVVLKPVVKETINFNSDTCFSVESSADNNERYAIVTRMKRVATQPEWKYTLQDVDVYMDMESIDEKYRSIVEEEIVKFKIK